MAKKMTIPEYYLELDEHNHPVLTVVREYKCEEDLCKKYSNMVRGLNEWFRLDKSGIERVFIIGYNMNLYPVGVFELSRGSSTHFYYSNRELGIVLLLMGAEQFTIFHNHPAKILKSSQEDLDTLETIEELSELLEIKLNNSVIVTEGGFYLEKDGTVWTVD